MCTFQVILKPVHFILLAHFSGFTYRGDHQSELERKNSSLRFWVERRSPPESKAT
jgi:hypothetical protein